jgi:tagatose 6-phosphate kinase
MILTITANPLLDHLAAATVVPGRVTRVTRFNRVLGGKGLNVAQVLARLGHRVTACGFAGGLSGEAIIALTCAAGIEPAFTATAAPTRVGFLAVTPGGTTALLENGGPITGAEQDALVAEVAARLPGCRLVIIGGAPPPGCDELYVRLLATCRAAGTPCWIDAHGPAMHAVLPFGPDLAKPNREEYGDGVIWEHVAELHLSDGPGAVRVRDRAGAWIVTPPPVAEVNPIGSGDCYVAGLAHARLTGLPFADQLRWAAAAGAANAARADVAQIGDSHIRPLLTQVGVARA